LETYGLNRYIQDSNAKIISQDGYGTLYRKQQVDDEALVMVKVKNSTHEHDGSFKYYFIRIPPKFGIGEHSPEEAIAWTFGLSKKEYNPNIET
jgi:hypothetical protein